MTRPNQIIVAFVRRTQTRLGWRIVVPAGVALAAVALSSQALSATSDRDLAFGGGDGLVTTDFGDTDDDGQAVAVQAEDGKIVVAGGRNVGAAPGGQDFDSDDFALARYAVDGSLDPSFGAGGKVVTDFGTDRDEARSVVLQSDGKIVAGGWNGVDFQLARYNADGSLDTTFDGDGKVSTDMGGGDFVEDLAIQADGKIVAVGGTAAAFAIARYLPSGALDPTFDDDGTATALFPGGGGAASAVAIQADGAIVVAGRGPCAPICRDFALARYDADGRLDASFDGDGMLTTDFGGDFDSALDVAVQADGKIVAAGRGAPSGVGISEGFAVARYLADGSLDASFDGDGKALVPYEQGSDAEALVLQPGGKIVLGGGVWRGPQQGNFALARLDTDGSIDTSFSLDGRVDDDFGAHDRVTGLALEPDGKIVAAGLSAVLSEPSPAGDFAVVRYLANGEVETVPPETEIVAGPADTALASTTATFAFVGSDNIDAPARLVFSCSLDGAAFASCTSPAESARLGEGRHVFAVRAVDRAGNADPTPATRSWTVDLTPPDTAISEGPPPLTRSRSATFSLSGSDALSGTEVVFECTLDSRAPARCTSPQAFEGLGDGAHRLAARAIDGAGNVDPSPAEHRWTVDSTAPAKPRVRGPRKTRTRRATYRFSSADEITAQAELEFRCAVDSSRLRACARVFRVRLRPGRHVLRVAAVDEVGNVSAIARVGVNVQKR